MLEVIYISLILIITHCICILKCHLVLHSMHSYYVSNKSVPWFMILMNSSEAVEASTHKFIGSVFLLSLSLLRSSPLLFSLSFFPSPFLILSPSSTKINLFLIWYLWAFCSRKIFGLYNIHNIPRFWNPPGFFVKFVNIIRWTTFVYFMYTNLGTP